MKAEAVSFLEDFIRKSVGARYVIPVYQRNYAWKKNEQVKKLLEDIQFLLQNPAKKHFIGSLVYVVTRDNLTIQERSVVDGQQRLTTLFIFLYALKSLAVEQNNEAVAKSLADLYLENNNSEERYKLRLKPSVSDDNVFEMIATGKVEEITQKTSCVYENYIFAKSQLSSMLDKNDFDAIVSAMRRLYVVYISLDKEDNPQQIFESINSTGMDLTSADLVRNFILMNKENDTQENLYNNYWLKIENIFAGTKKTKKLEGFFRFYLGTKRSSLSSQKKLYIIFQDYWAKMIAENKSEEEMLQDIFNFARHYERLYFKNENDILGEEIFDFRRIESEMPAPLAMSILELNRIGRINETQTKMALKTINTYMTRRYLADKDTSHIVNFFPTIMEKLQQRIGTDYSKFNEELKRALVNDTRQKPSFMPDDSQVRGYFSTANAYSLRYTRWLLEKIEKHQNTVGIVTGNLSIEHIMPQTKSDKWSEVADTDLDTYEDYINRLGNLTLASINDNSKMYNHCFEKKKEVLEKTGHINMNKFILSKDRWGLEEIEYRTELLINKILEMFPYERAAGDCADVLREIFIQMRGECYAKGYLHQDGTVSVYEDSQINITFPPSAHAGRRLREHLLDDGIIVEKNDRYYLTQKQDFATPSAAAEFCVGGSKNGWDLWRTKDGTAIKEMFKEGGG